MTSHLEQCLFGLAVGDALGFPFEKFPRGTFSCTTMTSSSRFPKGTWSDDTAMTVAELVSLGEKGRVDFDDMSERFFCWMDQGRYSCTGTCNGIGHTTMEAIRNYMMGSEAVKSGLVGIRSNGNGALMRLMPFSLLKEEYRQGWDIKDAISMTHRHPISLACCIFYDHLLRALLFDSSLQAAYEFASERVEERERTLIQAPHWEELVSRTESEMKSDAYVVSTLFTSVWCVEKTTSYKEAVLKAVNLGEDSDTTASVTGVIAALKYGIGGKRGVPKEWIDDLRSKEMLGEAVKLASPMML